MSETLITDQRSQTASYKILRRLGKGGMAEVFLARQEGIAGFRRLTVIKKLLPQFSQVGDVAEMLLDEARIAAQLTHPNIVQIYELGRDGGSYFIAMEYVDGCDLATLARIERHRQSRVPLRLTLRVVSEAAMGLDYAHRQTGLDGRPLSIVHRDVSPHNLMCSREGAVKVTDFGIAKAVGKALVTQVGVVKGKVQYMSPEQYVASDVDNRSDIFSLGVVLYQLTTGKLPRVAKDGSVAMRRVIEGQIPRPSEIRPDYPEELEAIVMRALAHNPEERYPDAASLREDLLEFARENDLLAYPKELGDYVDAQVPAQPLVVREQSMVNVGGAPAQPAVSHPSMQPPTPSAVFQTDDASELPSVMVDGEESDTEAPAGTEVASPGARRTRNGISVVTDHRSDPFGVTEIPIDASAPAVLPDEQPTPMGLTPALPLSNQAEIPTDRRPHGAQLEPQKRKLVPPTVRQPEAKQPPRERKRRSEAPVDPPRSAEPAGGRTATLLAAIAVIVALSCVGALVYFFVLRPQPTDPSRPVAAKTATPRGAGVINVLANPSKAVVSVDGARRCPSTPCQIAGLPLGREIVLTVRATGHRLWLQRLVLTNNEPKLLLRADLTPAGRTPPAAATKPAETEPQPKSTKAATAPSTKTARKPAVARLPGKVRPGRRPATKPAAAKKGASPKGTGKMITTDIEGDRALLAVDVRPWAEIWIDGKKVGHTPMQVQLPPGPHKVELKNPDIKFSKIYKIKARKGKKTKISLAIQPPGSAQPKK
jgi:eukaryotic-like serine/threonine-protein kinase